jgi:putative inorganic carbon (hco3(-)) transporter
MTFYLLAAFTIVLFVRPQEIYPVLGEVSLQKILALAALISLVPFLNQNVLGRFNNKIIKYLCLYLLAILISIPFSLWPGGSVNFLLDTLFKQVIILFIIIVTVDSYDKLKKILFVIGISTVFLALLAVSRYLSGQYLIGGFRATVAPGTFGDPNDLALHFVFAIPLLYFVGYMQTKKKKIFIIMILILVCAVLITFSRGGILGLCSSILAIWFFDKSNRKKNTFLIAMSIVLLLFLNITPALINRMETLTGSELDTSGSIDARWKTFKAGVEVFLEHPIVGVGLSGFVIAEGAKHGGVGKWNAAHNSFLQVAAETGIGGLITFIGCCYLLLTFQMKTKRDIDALSDMALTQTGLRISALGFLVCATFLSQAYSWYFFYLVGLNVATKNILDHIKNPSKDFFNILCTSETKQHEKKCVKLSMK